MQGKQAKMVSPTQERAILGYLATTHYPHRDRVAVYLHIADKYHRLPRPTVMGSKRHNLGGYHILPAALSFLVTPSTPAMRTPVVCSGHLPLPLPTTLLAHIPAGCGHGGTRQSRTSRKLQTWSVSPAAIAGV
jgi:hypothetical protein